MLVLAICAAFEAVLRSATTATATAAIKESMVGGLNVTSDDLVGYAESNAYSDTSDAKIFSDIAWKINGCSTITQADLNNAVSDAIRSTQTKCRSGDCG